MTTKPKYTVGQEVWLVEPRRPIQLVPVTKVGRTLVTVEHYGRDRQFRIDTGIQTGTIYGIGVCIRTQDEQVESERRAAALKALRAAHVEFELGYERSFDTSTIAALAIVANPPEDLDGEIVEAITVIKQYVEERKS